jgi:c-di-GMP-binding flagellar brake protein YcgR
MSLDTQPAELGAHGGSDPWAPFRVGHPQECRTLLRQVRDDSVPVSLSAPGGAVCSTVLWSIEEQAIGFDAGVRGQMLAPLVDAGEGVAVAYLDSVKLQFDLHDLVLVHGARTTTLRAAMPREVYRFQRRQSFRVRATERQSPLARLRHPAIPEMRLALRVLDVSAGGCALWQPFDVPPLAVGNSLAEVEITLDAETRFVATLRLHHVSAIGAGSQGVRLGCEWALAGAAERMLLRYIDLAQKRRRLVTLRRADVAAQGGRSGCEASR